MKSFNEETMFVSNIVRIGMIMLVCVIFSVATAQQNYAKNDDLKTKEMVVYSKF